MKAELCMNMAKRKASKSSTETTPAPKKTKRERDSTSRSAKQEANRKIGKQVINGKEKTKTAKQVRKTTAKKNTRTRLKKESDQEVESEIKDIVASQKKLCGSGDASKDDIDGQCDFAELAFTPRSPLSQKPKRKARRTKEQCENKKGDATLQNTKAKARKIKDNSVESTVKQNNIHSSSRRKTPRKKVKEEEQGDQEGRSHDATESTKGKANSYHPEVHLDKIAMVDNISMTAVKSELSEDDSSDSESEWEEVEELPATQGSPMKSQVPKEAVEITVDLPGVLRMKRKRKKQEFDMIAYFQRQLNRYNKEQRIEMHKAHLVCLLASGFHSNSLCNNATLQALALSIIPTEYLKKTVRQYDVAVLLRIVKWFKSVFDIDGEVQEEKNAKLDDTLVKRFDERKVASEKELVYIFVILLRVLQLDCRLVISLQPMPYKNTVTQGKGPAKRQMSKKKKTGDSGDEISPTSKPKKTNNKKNASKDKASTTKKKAEDEPCTSKQSQMAAESETPVTKRTLRAKNDRKRTCALKATPIIDVDSEDEFLSDEDEYIASSPSSSDVSEDEESIQQRTPKQKTPKQKVLTTKRSKSKGQSSQARKKQSPNIDEVEVLSDSDFEDAVVVMATGPRKSAEKKSKKHSKKMISSDSDQSVEILKTKNVKEFKKGSDYWVEVYLATDEKWVCVDCVRSSVNHPEVCEKMATQPVSYVLAFSNDNCVKDVTCRYASKWMSHTRKQCVDQEWWEETLSPYQPRDTEKNENEDLALQAKLQQQPLPTSIGEFKNHPLYALTRHLLKFEAFYPEKPAILGYCRGEPVFSRQCVHTLHTRETWLKEGRVVRIGEEPYKMVKARPKPNRNYKDMESKVEPKVAVYGRWQTEEYIPPPAVDGKVPRNEHGNVELFLPTMLPKGTVHLQIPGLNRVARKLDIDCAPAMVGWDFHGGFSHPLYDGFVICEEFQETLVDAWQQDQQEMERKAREKREKRVYKNWKLLIKGLLIKERLKKRFATEDSSPPTVNTDSGDVSMDMKMSWPTNKQTKKRKRKEATSSKDLFPFEKL